MLKFFKKFVIFCFILFILSLAGAGAFLYWQVVLVPCPEMEESYIAAILGRESPVFYRDGKEKIGVLFEEKHRQYLPYDRIPKQFINAIVAAEDDQFFNHFGLDIPGIARAMIANIKAGRIVQGGSTITQQTAKNLFKRESRTYEAKAKELLLALRLEYRYSKAKILEFYSNQFFVSGNGHGLGVAARYYFDKEVEELSLLENAFIAGSVKSPNSFNPFTKKNRKSEARARERAKQRALYVLGNMYKNHMVSKADYQKAKKSEIEFNRGKMSYALNSIVDQVKDGLESPAIIEALENNGISNISTSGIRIITSIDKQIQSSAFHSLRQNLSNLDVRLRGYNREEVLKQYESLEYQGESEPRPGAFLFGVIDNKTEGKNPEDLRIHVSLGKKHPIGLLDGQGLERTLTARVKWEKHRWSKPNEDDLAKLLAQLQLGDKVFVSVREIDETGTPLLDLERFPSLQGAALVLREGRVKAMVGGMVNRFYNRATRAKRPMGSTFKPFLYAAALQLGWNSLDGLNNRRNVFVFQNIPYFPRPDHHSPHEEVSMAWAGVHSENVASVWLLYHLLDRLSPPLLREVAARLDMAPRDNGHNVERYHHFRQRIRDDYGIMINEQILTQAAYDRAVVALEADFLFDGRSREYSRLARLPYGLNFNDYAEEIKTQLTDPSLTKAEARELRLRKGILATNYLRLNGVYAIMQEYQRYYSQLAETTSLFPYVRAEDSRPFTQGYFLRNAAGELVFTLSLPEDTENLQLLSEYDMVRELSSRNEAQRQQFWENILIGWQIDAYSLRQVAGQMARELEFLKSNKAYSLEVLGSVRDYKVMLGLQYLRGLAKASGVTSTLEPVLSFPLGSNVISLLEAARMYETLVTGKHYFPQQLSPTAGEEDDTTGEGLAIIERLETPEGKIIYSASGKKSQVFDTRTSLAVANILENIVLHGTGRYAHQHVRLASSDPKKNETLQKLANPVPLLGKTGTANNFTNAAFLGFVPILPENSGSAMRLENGYTVGVYVGFDDNEPMEKGTTHISGSLGALPTWSDIAETILATENTGDRIDEVDLSFNDPTLNYPDLGQIWVPVADKNGGLFQRGASAKVLTFGQLNDASHFEPQNFFLPYWLGQRGGPNSLSANLH